MKISKKGEYAIRAMTALSLNYKKGFMQINEISKKEKIPKKFLEQILLNLKKAGLLQSKQGINGGYSLIKSPDKITLAEVIRIIDGALAPVACVSKWAHINCPEEKNCNLRNVMSDVRNAIVKILENITFDSMCKKH